MSYVSIVVIGYLFNLFCVIILTIRLLNETNTNFINDKKLSINLRQNKLIDNSINPFRTKDFIIFLPFSYGVQICGIIFKSSINFKQAIHQEIVEKDEFLTLLEKGYR